MADMGALSSKSPSINALEEDGESSYRLAVPLVSAENLGTGHMEGYTEGGEEHHHHMAEKTYPKPKGSQLQHRPLSQAEKEHMEKYEALDYDVVTNNILLAREANRSLKDRAREELAKWTIMFLIGFFTGLTAFAISHGVEALANWKFDTTLNFVEQKRMGAAYFVYITFNVIFVAVAVLGVTFIEPVAAGSGIPELKAYLNGTNYLRMLRLKTMFVKVIGVMFSVSGGLCIGKEGPLVHTGACLAANFSHAPKMPHITNRKEFKKFRTDRHKRDFVSAGAGAGVASAFGAPIGGILFSLEEASSFWSLVLTWRVFFCAMVSTFTLNVFQSGVGGKWMYVNSPGLVTFGKFQENAYQLWELPIFAAMGVVGGLMGALFNKINSQLCHWRRNKVNGHPRRMVGEVLAVGLLTASVSFLLPMIIGGCLDIPPGELAEEKFYRRYLCPEGQYNPTATAIFTTQEHAIKAFFHTEGYYGPLVLTLYGVMYFFLAVITYGIKVPSGLFVPCILIGCSYGRLVGEFMRDHVHFLGHVIHPGTYALVGASSMLGGVTRMTISLTVIVLETTNDIQYLLPTMMVVMISKWVGDTFNISLYDLHVELQAVPFVENTPPLALSLLNAEDIMVSPVVTFRGEVTIEQIITTLSTCTHSGFPVVQSPPPKGVDKDEERSDLYLGNILRSQLIVLIRECLPGGRLHEECLCIRDEAERLGCSDQDAARSMPWRWLDREVSLIQEDFSTTLSSRTMSVSDVHVPPRWMGLVVDLKPYMNRAPFAVQRSCPVVRVYALVRAMGIRHLVVVTTHNKVCGIITRKNIRSDFRQDLT